MSVNLKHFNTRYTFFTIFTTLILFLAACSPSAEKLNEEGNQSYAEQAYLEALELYQSAQIESPELAEPYYNAANAFYRQGNYPAALEQMQMAMQYLDEETLAESSLYNLGNTLFNTQDLGTAVEAYKQALLLNPEDQDAKYNLELALQQQEQEQQQQAENQDQQEDESQSENQDESDQQDQSGEEQESENDENQEEGDQSQDSDSQDEQQQEQEGDQSQENDQRNSDQQQDQGDGSGQPQQGEDHQEGEQPSQNPPPGQRMTEEQAKQLLAAIANDMETLQERLGQYLFARGAPPAQDW
jgi:Ca-activated chloride channel family protein